MEQPRDYIVQSVFLEDGLWQKVEESVTMASYRRAGQVAAETAKKLDDRFGDSHFWTVTLTGAQGDYCQLFHGRLS